MAILVFYKSIYQTFIANTNIVEVEIRKKLQLYRFFILYDNMNFYKYVYSTCIFNHKVQIN